MALVEIFEVTKTGLDSKRLVGFALDEPVPGTELEAWALQLKGWVLGRACRAKVVEVRCQGGAIQAGSVSLPRPDVARVYSDVSDARASGFSMAVGLVGVPTRFELVLEAVLEDGSRALLATVRGRHRPLETAFRPRLQPLMVTSFGRSGSTWLMSLLGQHPQVSADRIYPYETYAASYWMHMLKVLSRPADHLRSAHPDTFLSNVYQVGHHPSHKQCLTSRTPPDQRDRQYWLGRTYVEELAAFCQRGIESFYLTIAKSQEKSDPRYFAEKWDRWVIAAMFRQLYPGMCEILLVRDLRDVLCSIRSFNAKRGYLAFGRESVSTEEEYIRLFQTRARSLAYVWKGRSRALQLVRYEDLVLHPEQTLAGLLEHVSLDSSPAVISNMIEKVTTAHPEQKKHCTAQDPTMSVGRWQRDLAPAEQVKCTEMFADFLREFGYE
jgi:hypothetical protein